MNEQFGGDIGELKDIASILENLKKLHEKYKEQKSEKVETLEPIPKVETLEPLPEPPPSEEKESITIEGFCVFWRKHLINYIAEFYLTESIISYPAKPSCTMTRYYEANIKRAGERRELLLNELADFFKAYLYMICTGEVRHSRRSAYRSTSVKLPKWIPKGPRNLAWKRAWDHLSTASEEEILKRCLWMTSIFRENSWHSSYGGIKWGAVIRHLLAYMLGEINILQFVDGAICLVHNNCYIVDKLGVSISKLEPLLDLKEKSKSPLDITEGLYFIDTPFNEYEEFVKWMVEY